MKSVRAGFLLLLMVFSCSDTKNEIKIDSNGPKWIISHPPDSENLYFVGRSEGKFPMREGRERAIADAVSQIIRYIGFRVSVHLEDFRKIREGKEGNAYEWSFKQSVEGTGEAKLSFLLEDVYVEKLSDGKSRVFTLVKVSKAWIEQERQKEQLREAERKQRANALLQEIEKGFQSEKKMELLRRAIRGWFITRKSLETSDLETQFRHLILSLLQDFRLSLLNKPEYVYDDGGSDPIEVQIGSTDGGSVFGEVPLRVSVADSASFVVSGDKFGKAVFTLKDSFSLHPIVVKIAFDFPFLEEIREEDRGFFDEIQKRKEENALKLSLKPGNAFKLLPVTVLALRRYESKKTYEPNPNLRQKMERLLKDKGYRVLASTVFFQTDAVSSMESFQDLIKKKFKAQDRFFLVLESVIPLGKQVENFESVEVQLAVSLIRLKTGKIQKSFQLSSRKPGLNVEQARRLAEEDLIKKMMIMRDF